MASGELRRIARAAESLPRAFVRDAVKTISKAATKRLTADTGGDRSLSGAPGKIRVVTKVTGETIVTGTVAPAKRNMGQYTWLEKGTKPHINQGRFPGTQHPGTKGKQTWSDPVGKEMQALSRDMGERFRRMMGGL